MNILSLSMLTMKTSETLICLTNSRRDWCSASHGVLPYIHHKLLFIIAVTALVGNWSACTLPIFLPWKIFILQGGTVINWYFPIIKKSIYLATISSSFSKLSLSCWVILMRRLHLVHHYCWFSDKKSVFKPKKKGQEQIFMNIKLMENMSTSVSCVWIFKSCNKKNIV